ncbi:uncharacterized protein A4U43_C06F9560 [Asparagus officinalis]|uniref:RING-type domain-containing protein n=1 Tax=Asparagus officinalis TaxID=4686 RepID=A0A5P1ELC2_ASPOF|nr:E3 ubiquitin-protein ligase At1g63170-like [Asparagus officinalis]ONK66564.1 uncharacterized protein A4U43_C06F9560 [Asparagus officinalis]
MAVVPSSETQSEGQTDRHPLLMERSGNGNTNEHIIDIRRGGLASVSLSHGVGHNGSDELHYEGGSLTTSQVPVVQSSPVSPTANSRSVSFGRRADNYARRHRSPLNSGLWISIELVVNMSQIIAAIVVLSLSRHENPQAPLFAWIIGYTIGCFATLPHLYWRYIHRNNQGPDQDSPHLRQSSSHNNPPESTPYTAISVNQALEEENSHNTSSASQFGRNLVSPRLNAFVDHFKMALDCFFAVWFVVGNVWVFGGHSASDAPNLYRLCIVFLTFSCIGYAMPFILCAMICCCLPCIISIMGFREDLGQNRGATSEVIALLPTYKYKSRRSENAEESDDNLESQAEGGILAAGTDKERTISAEDAVCCICLAKYVDGDDLRELPCTHFFHMECVDKWLKINALCPLCKSEVGIASSTSSTNSDRRHSDRRVASGSDIQQVQ